MQAELVHFQFDFFPHLSGEELKIILEREKHQKSCCFKVFDENSKFYVLLDIDKESVHVRHIGGSFAWRWGFIEHLCSLVAHELGLGKISVIADKDFMKHAVNKLGFEKSSGDMYEKRI